jgi:Ca2+-transporting ATPase
MALMLIAGAWSALVNLALFRWALSDRSLTESMALVFVTLVLVEFVKAYSFRSFHHSVLRRPFENRWLNLAMVWEVILLVAVVYVFWLQAAVGTYPLSLADWGIAAGVAATVLPVLEVAKWWTRVKGLDV